MEDLKKRFVEAVQSAFPGAEIEIDPPLEEDDHDLSGIVIWEGFQDRDSLDRQRTLRLALETRLSREEMRHLSFFITATPRELGRMKAG